jgi:hypothetical protein
MLGLQNMLSPATHVDCWVPLAVFLHLQPTCASAPWPSLASANSPSGQLRVCVCVCARACQLSECSALDWGDTKGRPLGRLPPAMLCTLRSRRRRGRAAASAPIPWPGFGPKASLVTEPSILARVPEPF